MQETTKPMTVIAIGPDKGTILTPDAREETLLDNSFKLRQVQNLYHQTLMLIRQALISFRDDEDYLFYCNEQVSLI